MMKDGIISNLKTQRSFFLNSVSCLTEEDSGFKPVEEVYTAAQLVGHVAETYDWFIEGAFGKGFDMNFDNYAEEIKKYKSFDEAIKLFKEAVDRAISMFESKSDEEIMEIMTSEPMKGAPKLAIVYALADHTAHHRGALTVYSRMLGRVPKMPYIEE